MPLRCLCKVHPVVPHVQRHPSPTVPFMSYALPVCYSSIHQKNGIQWLAFHELLNNCWLLCIFLKLTIKGIKEEFPVWSPPSTWQVGESEWRAAMHAWGVLGNDDWLIPDFRGYHRHRQEAYWCHARAKKGVRSHMPFGTLAASDRWCSFTRKKIVRCYGPWHGP